jgi:hypothetical protein
MRKRVSRRVSRRLFRRTARRVHRRNLPKYISRGGIRL